MAFLLRKISMTDRTRSLCKTKGPCNQYWVFCRSNNNYLLNLCSGFLWKYWLFRQNTTDNIHFANQRKAKQAVGGVVRWGKGIVYLTSWGVQLRLAYSWTRPAILAADKGRAWMFFFFISSVLSLSFVFGGGRVVRRCCVSYITGASNWYWLTVGQGLLSL